MCELEDVHKVVYYAGREGVVVVDSRDGVWELSL